MHRNETTTSGIAERFREEQVRVRDCLGRERLTSATSVLEQAGVQALEVGGRELLQRDAPALSPCGRLRTNVRIWLFSDLFGLERCPAGGPREVCAPLHGS